MLRLAKHLVKCFYCDETFDANEEDFIKVNARRYAHRRCAEKQEFEKTPEEKDREELEDYIKKLFGFAVLPKRVKNQIDRLHGKEFNYSYSGIRKTLIYWFEVKGESLEKANDGIGIVEWVWDRAYDYWYRIYLLQEVNADKEIEKMYKVKNSVTIKSPKAEKKIKLFDIEGESNGQ